MPPRFMVSSTRPSARYAPPGSRSTSSPCRRRNHLQQGLQRGCGQVASVLLINRVARRCLSGSTCTVPASRAHSPPTCPQGSAACLRSKPAGGPCSAAVGWLPGRAQPGQARQSMLHRTAQASRTQQNSAWRWASGTMRRRRPSPWCSRCVSPWGLRVRLPSGCAGEQRMTGRWPTVGVEKVEGLCGCSGLPEK